MIFQHNNTPYYRYFFFLYSGSLWYLQFYCGRIIITIWVLNVRFSEVTWKNADKSFALNRSEHKRRRFTCHALDVLLETSVVAAGLRAEAANWFFSFWHSKIFRFSSHHSTPSWTNRARWKLIVNCSQIKLINLTGAQKPNCQYPYLERIFLQKLPKLNFLRTNRSKFSITSKMGGAQRRTRWWKSEHMINVIKKRCYSTHPKSSHLMPNIIIVEFKTNVG